MKFTLTRKQWEQIGKTAGWDGTKVKTAKKKKSPKQHGFMEQCMKENSDKGDPGAYCASIVDKVKGTTKWRGKK